MPLAFLCDGRGGHTQVCVLAQFHGSPLEAVKADAVSHCQNLQTLRTPPHDLHWGVAAGAATQSARSCTMQVTSLCRARRLRRHPLHAHLLWIGHTLALPHPVHGNP